VEYFPMQLLIIPIVSSLFVHNSWLSDNVCLISMRRQLSYSWISRPSALPLMPEKEKKKQKKKNSEDGRQGAVV
jgi:hypothetical protein